jgi:DNA-binding winged helix-turn-helix (wHTH) protein
VRLSLQEFELLSLLASRYGRICTREELGTAIWGRGNSDLNMLHRLVHRLKRKLGPELGSMVVSVAKRGYKVDLPFSPAETSAPPAS